MTERGFGPAEVAAAALVIGGALVIALPQHGSGIARLVLVTVAVAAGLYAAAVAVPEWRFTGRWMSPFNRVDDRGTDAHASAEIARIRSRLSGRRQRIDHGPPVPPEVLRMLKPLIRAALEREGLDPDDRANLESARRMLSPLSWAVLTSVRLEWPNWFRTVRSNEREVARVVHAVLDDLDRLGAGQDRSSPGRAQLGVGQRRIGTDPAAAARTHASIPGTHE